MRLQIEPTEIVTTLDGVECRVWNGISEHGAQCFVFVHRIAIRAGEPGGEALEAELDAVDPPASIKR
jgi:hypothetical protein